MTPASRKWFGIRRLLVLGSGRELCRRRRGGLRRQADALCPSGSLTKRRNACPELRVESFEAHNESFELRVACPEHCNACMALRVECLERRNENLEKRNECFEFGIACFECRHEKDRKSTRLNSSH